MRLRVRGPEGQSTLTIDANATVGDLQMKVSETTQVLQPEIKYGYPPKSLSLDGYEKTKRLSDLGIMLDGEQLIVSRANLKPNQTPQINGDLQKQAPIAPSSASPSQKPSNTNPQPPSFSFANVGTAPASPPLSLTRKPPTMGNEPPELPFPSHAATLLLRIMPDDNSCLFRAFNSAFFGFMDNMHELRSIIAQYIQSHPSDYPAAVLDKEPNTYCRWIQREDAWGGFIELDILSKHFDLEICSIDVQTLRVDRFGEGKAKRCILVYSGIHYDVVALSPSDLPHTSAYAPPEFDTKVFDAEDELVLQGAMELCTTLQKQHYFTDTAKFNIRCNVCGMVAAGEKGATEHASKTGHYDFLENV